MKWNDYVGVLRDAELSMPDVDEFCRRFINSASIQRYVEAYRNECVKTLAESIRRARNAEQELQMIRNNDIGDACQK